MAPEPPPAGAIDNSMVFLEVITDQLFILFTCFV